MQHVCQNLDCNSPFESPHKKAKFCCRECADKGKDRNLKMRVCRLCESPLEKPGQIKLWYCSKNCRDSDPNRIVIDGMVHTTCQECGKHFTHERWKTNDYCSKACANAAMRHVTIVRTECENCHDIFEHRSNCPRRFCTKDCFYKYNIGENNPTWNSIETKCGYCDKPLRREQKHYERSDIHFCDQQCRASYYAQVYVGENHPLWKGGAYSNRGKGWNTQRRKAWERDKYKCQHCGKTKKQIGRHPDVHHIIPFREFGLDRAEEANQIENLITLCPDCHMKAEHNLIPIQPYLL